MFPRMQDPRNLRVYQRAKELAVDTRRVTGTFPSTGYSDLKNQMHRAVESIPSNIAEGCGADTSAEFARFLGISMKSASELEGQIDLAASYGIVTRKACTELTDEVVVVRKMLYKLRKRVRSGGKSDPDDTSAAK